jgi:hypothetical protein
MIREQLTKALQAKIVDKSTLQAVPSCKQLGCLAVVDPVTLNLNRGYNYTLTDVVSLSTAIQEWHLETPAATDQLHMHAVFSVASSGQFELRIYEGSNRSGDTELDIYNNNRESSSNANTKIYRGTTGGDDDGTLIFKFKAGASGNPNARAPGAMQGFREWILAPDTKYHIEVETFNSDVSICFNIEFIEFEYVNP